MGIKQKFMALTGLVGVMLAALSAIGYYTAHSNLEESVEKEISASVALQGAIIEGWLQEKAKPVTSAADLMTELERNGTVVSRATMHSLLSLAASDKDVQEMTRCDEQGMFMPYYHSDWTGLVDPHSRAWYGLAREAGRTVYTDVYVSKSSGDLVVSAVAPFYGGNHEFRGAICTDISLEVIKEQVDKIKYREEGSGYIIEKTGKVLAMANGRENMLEARNLPGIGEHIDEIFAEDKGYLTYESGQQKYVFAYETVPSTGWVVGMSVPYGYVFGSVMRLRVVYAVLTLAGLLLVLGICWSFAKHITEPILTLELQARTMARGDLTGADVPVASDDEVGSLTQAFNTMKGELRRLINHVAKVAEQVSASSEELSASAQQSSLAAVSVVESIDDIASGMDSQLRAVDGVKQGIDRLYAGIDYMGEQASAVSMMAEQASDMAGSLEIPGEHLDALLEMADGVRQASTDIVRTVASVSESATDIVGAMDDMDTVSRNTSDHAQAISAVTEEQSASYEEIASASQALAQMASDMQDAVHKFKL